MSTIGTILIIIWFGFNGLDAWSSLRFKYRGGQERFKIFTDKYGDFSLWRYAAFSVLVAVIAVLSEVFAPTSTVMPSWIGVAVLVGLASFTRFLVAVFKNLKNGRENRKKQITLLRNLRDNNVWPNAMEGMKDGNRYRWELTQWIYKDDVHWNDLGERQQANQEFLIRLRRSVQEPEANWFKKPWVDKF
jgi:hypothetical protein